MGSGSVANAIAANAASLSAKLPTSGSGSASASGTGADSKQKKKRGRKATLKFYSSTIRKQIPLDTVIYDNDSSVLHLDIAPQEDNVSESACNPPNSEYRSAVDNSTDDILGEYIDALDKMDITDLYEQRLEARRAQDDQLIKKLADLNHDDALLYQLLDNVSKTAAKNGTSVGTGTSTSVGAGTGTEAVAVLAGYIEMDRWVDQVDVACWWCCHKFDLVPVGFPVYCRKGRFRVKGVYCSFACMIAAKGDYPLSDKTDSLINALYTSLTGGVQYKEDTDYTALITKYCDEKNLFSGDDTNLKDMYIKTLASFFDSPLQPAPPRCMLKMFGGTLTIEEFRQSTKERKVYRMIEYPMYPSRDYTEKVDLRQLKQINKTVFGKPITADLDNNNNNNNNNNSSGSGSGIIGSNKISCFNRTTSITGSNRTGSGSGKTPNKTGSSDLDRFIQW